MPSISKNRLIGRFAPSPTGPLHFGSLIAATASYLNVRQQKDSRWLLRIEDLDSQRSQQKHAKTIINQLEAYGFAWDGDIVYQSQRTHAYQVAFDKLSDTVFPCSCTRKTIQASQISNTSKYSYIYPGTCRNKPINPSTKQCSFRLRTELNKVCFTDHIQGVFCQKISSEVGDFILKRADGSFTYQLAVVVDDAWQGINQITRGADLIDNTPRQLYLQKLLGFTPPDYAHFPVITANDGKKLSKQNQSPEVSTYNKRATLIKVLAFLGQSPPSLKDFASVGDLWSFAMQNWDQNKVPKVLTQMSIKQG